MTSFCLVITFLDISLSFVWVNILLVASSVLFNHFYLSRQIKTHIPICLLMTWCLCVYWREGEISSNKKSVIVFWAEKLIWFTQVVLPLQESLCIIAQSDAVSVKLTLHGYNHLSHRLKRGRSETCLFTFTSYFLFPTWGLFQKILLYNVNFSSYIWVDSELGLLCCFVFVESIRKGKEYSLKAPSPCLWHLRLPFHLPRQLTQLLCISLPNIFLTCVKWISGIHQISFFVCWISWPLTSTQYFTKEDSIYEFCPFTIEL